MNTEEIIEGYLGNTEVNSIYQGSELVWTKYFGNRYLIGGMFTTPKNKIIRLNDNDSIDNTWYNNSSLLLYIYKLIYDNINKKIYAAGDSELDGGLVRFNLDGTKDTSFNIGTGFNDDVNDINIDTINQKLYVGGWFNKYNGSTQNNLVRLNMNGSKDTSFNIGLGFNNDVWNIKIDNTNSKIYVGGLFTIFNGNTQNKLVRLNMDGSKDTSFNIGTGFDGIVFAIDLDRINQKIYVGGTFTTFNSFSPNRLVRLNMNGLIDISFSGGRFNNDVRSIKIDKINQKLYVGGYFTTYDGNAQNRLIRLNMNGTKDTSFNIGTGFNDAVYDILIDNEKNKIYIAGGFTTYNNQQQKYIARLNMDGSLDNTFNIELNNAALTILKYTE